MYMYTKRAVPEVTTNPALYSASRKNTLSIPPPMRIPDAYQTPSNDLRPVHSVSIEIPMQVPEMHQTTNQRMEDDYEYGTLHHGGRQL